MTDSGLPAQYFVPNVMCVQTIWMDETTPLCIFRMMKSNIDDEYWQYATTHLRKFLKWIKKHGYKYHFLFDLHEVDSIPLDRLYGLQQYLRKKRDFLLAHLHSSAIITQSHMLQMVLNNAFDMWPPTRPFKMFVHSYDANDARDENTGIPDATYSEVLRHLHANKLA